MTQYTKGRRRYLTNMSANDKIIVYKNDGIYTAKHIDVDTGGGVVIATGTTIEQVRAGIKLWEEENPYPVEYGTSYLDSCFEETKHT